MIKRILRILISTRLRAVLSIGMVLGIGAVSTMAYWSDSTTVTTGNFSLGSVDLKLNDQDSLTWTAMNQSDMQPGSSKAATLTVKNAGGFNFTYSATIAPVPTGLMKYHGVFRVYSGATPVNANGVGKCSGGTAIGTLEPGVKEANMTTTSSIPALPTWTGHEIWDNWATGKVYSWIASRSLAAGQSENLCVWIAAAPDTLAADQNDSISATWTFTATQAA